MYLGSQVRELFEILDWLQRELCKAHPFLSLGLRDSRASFPIKHLLHWWYWGASLLERKGAASEPGQSILKDSKRRVQEGPERDARIYEAWTRLQASQQTCPVRGHGTSEL